MSAAAEKVARELQHQADALEQGHAGTRKAIADGLRRLAEDLRSPESRRGSGLAQAPNAPVLRADAPGGQERRWTLLICQECAGIVGVPRLAHADGCPDRRTPESVEVMPVADLVERLRWMDLGEDPSDRFDLGYMRAIAQLREWVRTGSAASEETG